MFRTVWVRYGWMKARSEHRDPDQKVQQPGVRGHSPIRAIVYAKEPDFFLPSMPVMGETSRRKL